MERHQPPFTLMQLLKLCQIFPHTVLHSFQYINSYLADIYLAITAVFLKGATKGLGRVTKTLASSEK